MNIKNKADVAPVQSESNTLGPLIVADAMGTLCAFRIIEAGERERTVAFIAHSGSNSQDRANADLFVAAPELLMALKDCVAAMKEWGYGKTGVCQDAKTAIAKAQGNTQ